MQVIGSGVAQQLESFRAGFNEVFPMRHLEVYTAEELVLHIRGDVEAWDLDTLRARCSLSLSLSLSLSFSLSLFLSDTHTQGDAEARS
jgi:hypothetical protein